MTDLESYRKWAGDWRKRANDAKPAAWAIAEIERLRAWQRARLETSDMDRAEIERLWAALGESHE